MKTIVFALPGNDDLAGKLASRLEAETGKFTIRQFPDGETYIRIHSGVREKRVVMVCTLNNPDEKLLPLFFLSQAAKEQGAECTCLVAPYLAYMRQDKQFQHGEGVTSAYFAKLISGFAETLTTVDPHLHRRNSLSEIYSVPAKLIHAASHISEWIRTNVKRPVLIGPDSESEQWVSQVATEAGAPFTVLSKVRRGDRDVEISIPDLAKYKDRTPVLVDDIISTARTMIETVIHLKTVGMHPPFCVGIHAVFAGSAYNDLKNAGVQQIVTCNTIPHESNQIDLSDTLEEEIKILINPSHRNTSEDKKF